MTAEIEVVYTSAACEYAEKHGIALNEPIKLSAHITLVFRDKVSAVPNPLRPQVEPYGWSITSVEYRHVSP